MKASKRMQVQSAIYRAHEWIHQLDVLARSPGQLGEPHLPLLDLSMKALTDLAEAVQKMLDAMPKQVTRRRRRKR